MSAELLLEARGIRKEFPGVLALNNVDLDLRKGEVLALMGENGAGKSTLIKILNGIYSLNAGDIFIEGQRVTIENVQKAAQLGITAVHQELNLIPYISVAENIFLGRYPCNKVGDIEWHKMFEEAQQILDDLEVPLDAHAELCTLNTALQQMVAIARSVSTDCKILILDEPTSSLDDAEVTALFNVVGKLKARGVGIIFITHRMNEIYLISDRITILKDGCLVGTYLSSELPMDELVNKMVGRKISNDIRNKMARTFGKDDYILKVSHLARAPKVHDVSFGVHRGEILGITGLLGSGRSETAEVIFGCDEMDAGEIEFDGRQIGNITPQQAVKLGMAFCTEDRRGKGIIGQMSVMNNIALASLRQVSNGIVISNRKRLNLVKNYVDKLAIKTPSYEQHVVYLSGGNQQKAILARWLASKPKLMILDEPTRGIDIGAKQEIEKLVLSFANQGISVIYITSEIPELIRNCDRVVVFRDGVSVGELVANEITEENIMATISGGYSKGGEIDD